MPHVRLITLSRRSQAPLVGGTARTWDRTECPTTFVGGGASSGALARLRLWDRISSRRCDHEARRPCAVDVVVERLGERASKPD